MIESVLIAALAAGLITTIAAFALCRAADFGWPTVSVIFVVSLAIVLPVVGAHGHQPPPSAQRCTST